MSSTPRRRAAARSFWAALACPLAGVLLVLLYPTAAWVFDAVILLWWACAAALTLGTWYALRPAGVVLRVLGAGTVACVTVVMAPLLGLVAYILSGGDATLDIPVMLMSLR